MQTACSALPDLFARTTATMAGSRHFRPLNHREAERHLPQQFGGSRVDYGDYALRMEDYAAVLSRDGHGGAQVREVAKPEKFECGNIGALEMSYWDVQQLAAALVTCTRERWQHW